VASKASNPPDQDQRDIILHELDRALLVEAAAGTGKTTAMIGRMVNLLGLGRCSVETLAAVTFTRKAAAELRTRFQIQLEKACRQADGRAKKLLRSALLGAERCFIGTIHSFCARMLRERPVEAGVDIAFEEIDENVDQSYRRRAWDLYVASLYDENSPLLDRLEKLGVEIGQLLPTFMKFADYPDVDSWPARRLPLPDPSSDMRLLERFVRHMETLTPTFPQHVGNDKLMRKYQLIPLMFRQARLDQVSEVMEVLDLFRPATPVQKLWPCGPGQAKAEEALWNEFTEDVAKPLVKKWLEYRYEPLLEAIKPAITLYDELRKRDGRLNYQDLLMHASRLLRDKPSVREYFRGRFTHLLVDEFQDTDPIQAEVLMFLTADDHNETDWRKCKPVGGSLFLVGDPKQSIYRFRRADIVTYNQVKDIIIQSGGMVAHLSANFRTVRPLIDWVNSVFENDFNQFPAECSPEYVPLLPVRDMDRESQLTGIRSIRIPKRLRSITDISEYDAGLISRTIRRAIDQGLPVARSEKELESGIEPKATPGDFLIVTPNTGQLSAYGHKLQELGIPHQVTGGSALNQLPELILLRTCLASVTQPDNPVALLAVLRSELFGISDEALFLFKRHKGGFTFNSEVPAALEPPHRFMFEDAFTRLKRYASWMKRIPVASAIEKILADLGLTARSVAAVGGDMRAGSLAKAVELIRASQNDFWTPADVVDRLTALIEQEENHDSIPARSHHAPVALVMNLHKVKGLEAPVVFLADPTGKGNHPATIHVDRSGAATLGYMTIEGNPFGSSQTVLAQPEQWESLAARENDFRQAEDLRLLYVAATRAGCGLTISQRDSYQNQNPWAYFDPKLRKCGSLVDPGPQAAPARPLVQVTDSDIASARANVSRRWVATTMPTYAVTTAKAATVEHGEFTYSQGDNGTEWGSAVHVLLQALMLNPEADVNSLAAAALEDQGLDTALTEVAAETARSVTRSEVWKRALASKNRLVEVPFQTLRSNGPKQSDTVPTIVRGVIDLAFEEPEGWVIIDYKSDRVSEARVEHLAEVYKPQVLSYREAWTRITAGRVKEAGLYFTHCARYVQVC
jgi:ATP-dependent helicase/nuclease subunit A